MLAIFDGGNLEENDIKRKTTLANQVSKL